ncbi:hypothetical protein BXY82_2497 [Gelidibacter sediminis]|uniref:Uncharacterized protein n=1 Tax=Gelidibacter sediminis TaxID=1608710 RepID=A0A4R7PZK2_9FLAO|nr:hypothetical protein [Gelidibacter sediminis]TDU40448.1 hypothetical protein BXY82_2497 [Gelidibacter sediminis]
MSHTQKDQETDRKDSSTKHARGSKKVHSERDDSTEDGFKPNKTKK